ncbi:hypothetical protein F5Y17DRAFT_434388 [Xylariaceae sp. FL0594]|nr:hypothetical protein F5Y17DRAFT_434388 [Xylariaceae sp. FL0594]
MTPSDSAPPCTEPADDNDDDGPRTQVTTPAGIITNWRIRESGHVDFDMLPGPLDDPGLTPAEQPRLQRDDLEALLRGPVHFLLPLRLSNNVNGASGVNNGASGEHSGSGSGHSDPVARVQALPPPPTPTPTAAEEPQSPTLAFAPPTTTTTATFAPTSSSASPSTSTQRQQRPRSTTIWGLPTRRPRHHHHCHHRHHHHHNHHHNHPDALEESIRRLRRLSQQIRRWRREAEEDEQPVRDFHEMLMHMGRYLQDRRARRWQREREREMGTGDQVQIQDEEAQWLFTYHPPPG